MSACTSVGRRENNSTSVDGCGWWVRVGNSDILSMRAGGYAGWSNACVWDGILEKEQGCKEKGNCQ